MNEVNHINSKGSEDLDDYILSNNVNSGTSSSNFLNDNTSVETKNVDSIIDLVKGTVQGQSFWMEKLSNVVKGYPAFNDLVLGLDNNLSSLSDYFSPPLTFTRVLQVTGIGDAVNTIIVCAVQGVGFFISMRLLFWSLGRVKLTMIKPIK